MKSMKTKKKKIEESKPFLKQFYLACFKENDNYANSLILKLLPKGTAISRDIYDSLQEKIIEWLKLREFEPMGQVMRKRILFYVQVRNMHTIWNGKFKDMSYECFSDCFCEQIKKLIGETKNNKCADYVSLSIQPWQAYCALMKHTNSVEQGYNKRMLLVEESSLKNGI